MSADRPWRRLKSVAAIVGLVVLLLAPAANAESLHDALIATSNHSESIKASHARVEVQAENVEQARSRLFPQVSLAPVLGYRYPMPDALTASLELALELLVYDGGSQKLAIEIEEANTSIARQILVQTEQEAFLNTVTAYFDVLKQQQGLALERQNLQILQTQLDAARERYAVGQIARTEVNLVEARLALIRSSVAQLQGQLTIANESYKLYTGQYPGRLEATQPVPEFPSSLEDAVAIANKAHPRILNARLAVTIADLNIERAKTSTSAPNVSLRAAVGGSRQFGSRQSWDNSWSVQLGGQIPLYAGGLKSSLYRQAVANSSAARYELHRTAASVMAEVTNAWTHLDILGSVIAATREQVEYSRLAYEGVQAEADLGTRSTLDVLDAENDFRQAQTQSINAVLDRNVAMYALLASIGQLTAETLGL